MKFWQVRDASAWWDGLDLEGRQWWLTFARTIRPLEAWACYRRQCEAGWFGPNDPFHELDRRPQPEVVH